MASSAAQPSFDDREDFHNATRGFVGTLTPCIVKNERNEVIWDNEDYAFLDGQCPHTVNSKLWRQSQLCRTHGLFEVTKGIYQIRGLDVSNMTIAEGQAGIVVIDTLLSIECAKAALALYRQHRGVRSVKAVIYSHSHADHFGGALGVLPEPSEDVENIPIIAPMGFIEETASENIFVGPAMRRRAVYMFGSKLPRGPTGHVGCGLGIATSSGTVAMVPPNDSISYTGEERIVDGVRIVFQMVPETEAPAEMNMYFPQHRALCISECATHNMHNVSTLRGALVRDAKKWAKHLDETIELYGTQSDVQFAGHHWPTWGTDSIVQLVSQQRDLYSYMHDQTVRMINLGLNGTEIAERMVLPPQLAEAWHTQGFYGSLSHNVKAIYQRYMTWFDGNAASLWKHPRAEEGQRYVECMGGVDAVVAMAQGFVDRGDLRFAATLLDHGVAADPDHQPARSALAGVFQQLGLGSENATWRNFYLSAAQELIADSQSQLAGGNGQTVSALSPGLSMDQLLDALSVRLNGPKASELDESGKSPNFTIAIEIPEEAACWSIQLSNGTLSYRRHSSGHQTSTVGLSLTLSRVELSGILSGGSLDTAQKQSQGNLELLVKLLDYLEISAVSQLSSIKSRDST